MRVSIGIALTAFVTLTLELILTRVFDVILTPNLAYMVITCALLAFGVAGLYATLRPLPEGAEIEPRLAAGAAALGASLVAVRPALNALPFDFDALAQTPVLTGFAFLAMYLVLLVPFFFSGLVLTWAFSRYTAQIQRLYAWDLAGAGLGCVAWLPLLPRLGPGGVLWIAAALAFGAAAVFAPRRPARIVTGAAAVAAVAVGFLLPAARLDFREHAAKRGVREAHERGTIEFSRWDPISKIDVIPLQPNVKHIAYDGGNQSSYLYGFDGDLGALRRAIDANEPPGIVRQHAWKRDVYAAHYLRRDQGSRVLIFGSAGGQETKAALVYGAAAVDAVELVGTVVELGHERYADFIGRIFNDPRVHVHVAEGRSYLRASGARYDIIQIFSNYTSSSIAQGTGALSPDYLHTADAFREFFTHLTDDGILQVNQAVYPRVVSTAALAWRQLGRTDFRRFVAVVEHRRAPDNLPTVLIRMRPWTAPELADLMRFMTADPVEPEDWLAENPLDPAHSFLSDGFYAGDFPRALDRSLAYNAWPTTDDRPLGNLFRRRIALVKADPAHYLNASTAVLLNSQLRGGRVPMDLIHLAVTAAVSLTFVLLLIVVPLKFSGVGRVSWPGRRAALTYFAALGAGFITIELVLIQIFMQLVGYPLYAVAVVVFTLLVAAAGGSRLSLALGISPARRWVWPFVGVLVTGAALLAMRGAAFHISLAWPMSARVAAAVVLIAPLGLCLGMPFPLGLLALEGRPAGSVAWAWGLNGVFTVVGGVGSMILAIAWGFERTIITALVIYAIALAAFARLRAAR